MPRMYVVVRNDLTPGQKAVQAGHALSEWLLKDQEKWKNTTLIYLAIADNNLLEGLCLALERDEIDYVQFNEPDLNNEITAIASFGTNKYFKNLPLLR